jgi:hypothetical protein
MPRNYIGTQIDTLKFRHPVSIFVSGASGTGKSEWIKNVIERDFIDGNIKKIYYFMPEIENIRIRPSLNQELYLMQGVPTKTWIRDTFRTDGPRDTLIVVDDLWGECIKAKEATRHLLKYCRNHYGISMIFVTQYFFEGGKPSIPYR